MTRRMLGRGKLMLPDLPPAPEVVDVLGLGPLAWVMFGVGLEGGFGGVARRVQLDRQLVLSDVALPLSHLLGVALFEVGDLGGVG